MFDCEEKDKKNTPFILCNNQTKYQIIHVIAALTLCFASMDQSKAFLKSVTHMFAFNYIKGLLFNNYLIYISNKLDCFFFFIFGVQPCQSISPLRLPRIKGNFLL